MNDRNLNPAYSEALASARSISTAAPRAVGEFQGFIDGEPSVRWIDRKNMPNVGDMLYAVPGRALQHAGFPITIWDGSKLKPSARSRSILLTSANHGTVGPLGSTFPHAGEKHERVQVVEIVDAGAPPAPDVDLNGLVRLNVAELVGSLDEVYSWARELPIPTRGTVSAMQKVRQVKETLAAAPVAVQAGQVAVPEGWTVERVGDAIHIKRADGKWCGIMPSIGPAAALTFEFLSAILAAAPSAPAVEQQAPAQAAPIPQPGGVCANCHCVDGEDCPSYAQASTAGERQEGGDHA